MKPFSLTATCVLCNTQFEARTSYGICERCYSRDALREWDRLLSAMTHARRCGLPASLSLPQWMHTVSDFQAVCAYCLTVPFSQIHLVDPMLGLVYENVVPCCKACSIHLRSGFELAKQRVQVYLEQNQNEEEGEEVEDDGTFSPTEHVPTSQFMAELFAMEPWRIGNPQQSTGGEPA